MKKEKYTFTFKDIGPALAYIVSQFEGEEYIFETIDCYDLVWNYGTYLRNDYQAVAIVKEGLEICSFHLEDDLSRCPWVVGRIAHIIYKTTNLGPEISVDDTIDFENHFQNCIFPYLNDFIKILSNKRGKMKYLLPEEIMDIAINYVHDPNILYEENKIVRVRKRKNAVE